MERWPPPVYVTQVEIRAPRAFAYRWCTDFRANDAALIGESYERRVLERSKHRVVYEDLWWESAGWRWRRNIIALDPPNGWHAVSLGNVRTAEIDYRLEERGPDRTRFTLEMRRRPGLVDPRQPSKAELERELSQMWRDFGRALEADYRRSRARTPAKSRRTVRRRRPQ